VFIYRYAKQRCQNFGQWKGKIRIVAGHDGGADLEVVVPTP
jgi:hypothetical protein